MRLTERLMPKSFKKQPDLSGGPLTAPRSRNLAGVWLPGNFTQRFGASRSDVLNNRGQIRRTRIRRRGSGRPPRYPSSILRPLHQVGSFALRLNHPARGCIFAAQFVSPLWIAGAPGWLQVEPFAVNRTLSTYPGCSNGITPRPRRRREAHTKDNRVRDLIASASGRLPR
jgi:hypothetical protein